MTDNKEFPYEAEVLGDHYAVFGPTVLGRNEKGSQFYIGGFRKCASLSEALNLAYAAGVKAERGRCATIADTRTDGDWQGRAIAEAIRSGQEPGGER